MSRRLILLAVGGVAVAALAGAAYAQGAGNSQSTPFNYEIKDGKRVPKPTAKVVNTDGSWREETRQGSCVTIREGTPDGAVKTTRKCD